MNILQVAGRLGKDAEVRFTQGGQKVTTLTLASSVRRQGKEETIWWRCTIWGDRFDKLVPYFKKGSALIVIGELAKPTVYTDKEGNPQVSMDLTVEIVKFSPFGGNGSSSQENKEEVSAVSSYGAAPKHNSFNHDMDPYKDDSLPF
jgi:single-strand DNA-binding protein